MMNPAQTGQPVDTKTVSGTYGDILFTKFADGLKMIQYNSGSEPLADRTIVAANDFPSGYLPINNVNYYGVGITSQVDNPRFFYVNQTVGFRTYAVTSARVGAYVTILYY